MRSLISNRSVNYADPLSGASELHRAIIKDNQRAFELLIQKGENLEACNDSGNTPLNVAAYYGHFWAIKLLVEKNADLNTHNAYGNTPLHTALIRKHIEIAIYLIKKKADLRSRNNQDYTPLDVAKQKLDLKNNDNIKIINFLNEQLQFSDRLPHFSLFIVTINVLAYFYLHYFFYRNLVLHFCIFMILEISIFEVNLINFFQAVRSIWAKQELSNIINNWFNITDESKKYFYHGLKAEDCDAYYLRSFDLTHWKTYLPWTQASRAFQAGRAYQAQFHKTGKTIKTLSEESKKAPNSLIKP